MNVMQLLDLDGPPQLDRLLNQTHAGTDALWAELDNERARLDHFACRAGLRPDQVRQFVALGLLEESPRASVIGSLTRPQHAITVGLLLEVLEQLDALHAQLGPRPVSLWT